MTSHGHLDLARLLTEKITRKTRSLQPPRPHVPFRDTEAQSDTTSAQHLISVLARIWASKLGEESGRILEGAGAGQEHEIAKSISARAEQSWSSTDRRALLPPKHQADIWLQTFLCGPNKLMCICSPTESHRLLESLYGSKQEIGERSECLITSQLAVGARFTADTNEQIYTAIYESARMQAENCIEKDEAMFLWVVPILLLRCIYLLGTKPRSCWLILGELDTSRARGSKTETIDSQGLRSGLLKHIGLISRRNNVTNSRMQITLDGARCGEQSFFLTRQYFSSHCCTVSLR